MNLNRPGLRKIIDRSIEGKVNDVVIVHKDRLCRFGYDLIEDLIKKYSNGKIVIMSSISKNFWFFDIVGVKLKIKDF